MERKREVTIRQDDQGMEDRDRERQERDEAVEIVDAEAAQPRLKLAAGQGQPERNRGEEQEIGEEARGARQVPEGGVDVGHER